MTDTSIPSPGLEPPHPPLVIIPDRRRVCTCGKPLQTPEEIQSGECAVCTILNRYMPCHPCAGDLSTIRV